jgi:spermidine/putrescine transport system permease protein
VKKLRTFFKGTYLGLMLVFLYAPILVLIAYSFNSSKTMGHWTGFSLRWYEALAADTMIMEALTVTLTIAVLSAAIATVFGTFAAIGMHSMKKAPRRVVENISQLPVVNPDLVTGISLMMLFAFFTLRDGYIRLLIAHVTFNIPYVIFSVMPKLRQSSTSFTRPRWIWAVRRFRRSGAWCCRISCPASSPASYSRSRCLWMISWSAISPHRACRICPFTSTPSRGAALTPKSTRFSTLMFVVVVTLLLIINFKSIREERAAALQSRKVEKRAA